MQAPNSSFVILLVLLPLIGWRIYARFRRMVGSQRLSRLRLQITLTIFPTLVVLLGYTARSHVESLNWLAAGLLAGALLAAQVRLVTPADLGFATAAFGLLAVIIGGAGSMWGACLGAALVIVIRDALGPSLDGHGTLLLGVVFVLVVYLLPRGAAGTRWPRRRGSGP